MPAKRLCLLSFIILQAVMAVPNKSSAQPPWCPDLTEDYFVNFFDFSIMGNDWRESGPSLPGDFVNYGTVDINDLAYFAKWWLHDCYDPPPEFCPDCIYPDCNVMDCDPLEPPPPCSSCETTPPFIKVKLEGIQNCPCNGELGTWIHYENGEPWYFCLCWFAMGHNGYFMGSVDGNYILPYTGYCTWEGFFDISDMNVLSHIYSGCCVGPVENPIYHFKWLRVTAYKYFDLDEQQWKIDTVASLCFTSGDGTPNVDAALAFQGFITSIQNCIEGTANNVHSCSETRAPHGAGNDECCCYGEPGYTYSISHGDGTATITLPWEEEQIELLRVQEAVITWLQME